MTAIRHAALSAVVTLAALLAGGGALAQDTSAWRDVKLVGHESFEVARLDHAPREPGCRLALGWAACREVGESRARMGYATHSAGAAARRPGPTAERLAGPAEASGGSFGGALVIGGIGATGALYASALVFLSMYDSPGAEGPLLFTFVVGNGLLAGGGAALGAGRGADGFKRAFLAAALSSLPSLFIAAQAARTPVGVVPTFAVLQGLSAAVAARTAGTPDR